MKYNLGGHESLTLKPALQDTVKRWDAFWAGDIIDRPLVSVFAPNAENTAWYDDNYYTRIHNDINDVVKGLVSNAHKTVYLGEALPQPSLSFGCDEIAAFCGGTLVFSEGLHDTCWSEPFVDDWEAIMPIRVQEDHPLWLRMQTLMDKAAAAMDGKMLFSPVDTHSNMDMLLAMRGAERLCMDLIERPDVIDRAMEDSMAVYDYLYNRMFKQYGLQGKAGFVVVQCDFSCMISTPMFRRFALPYLEREAAYSNGRIMYHWDGVTALTHTDDLIASKNIYLLGFVPGHGNGGHLDFIDVYQRVQQGGKAVMVWGSADEVKQMHKSLRPDKTYYEVRVDSVAEGETLLEWFVKNT